MDIWNAFDIPTPIATDGAESIVMTGLKAISRGQFDVARTMFEDNFATVCRTDHPQLVTIDGAEEHCSACYFAYDECKQ